MSIKPVNQTYVTPGLFSLITDLVYYKQLFCHVSNKCKYLIHVLDNY